MRYAIDISTGDDAHNCVEYWGYRWGYRADSHESIGVDTPPMLTDKAVRAAAPLDRPRKLADGRGWYLLLVPNGSRLWRVKYRYSRRERL